TPATAERERVFIGARERVEDGKWLDGQDEVGRSRRGLARERALVDRVHRGHLVVVGGAVLSGEIGVARARAGGAREDGLGARRGTAVDLVARHLRAAVRGGSRPGERDLGVAARGLQVLGRRGRGRGGRGRRARLARERALVDRVHRGHLVVVGGAVLSGEIGVARARAGGAREDGLGARRGTAVDLVARHLRAAVRGGSRPGERDLGVAARGLQVLGRRGRGRGGRGRGARLARERALVDRVHRGHLVV